MCAPIVRWDVGSVLQLHKRSGTVSQIFLDLRSDAEAQLASAAPSQNSSDSEVGVEADKSRVRHAAEAQLRLHTRHACATLRRLNSATRAPRHATCASAAPSQIPCDSEVGVVDRLGIITARFRVVQTVNRGRQQSRAPRFRVVQTVNRGRQRHIKANSK